MSKYVSVDEIKRKYPQFLDEDFCIPYDERTLRDILDDEPAADVVEVRRGKWEVEGCYCMEIAICSECGIGTDEFRKFKYCPNCGAEMEIEDNGG